MSEILGTDEAIVWTVSCPGKWSEQHRRYWSALGPEERARMARLPLDEDRLSYLTAHGALRCALSHVIPGVLPSEWRFRRQGRGKPELAAPFSELALNFNISHTRQMAALILSPAVCGVDVEHVVEHADVDPVQLRVLSPYEAQRIAAFASGARRDEFFRLWTLKEAYSKARGLGLCLPFHALEFSESRHRIELRTPPHLDPRAHHWRFKAWRPSEGHVAAAAVLSAASTAPVRWRIYDPGNSP